MAKVRNFNRLSKMHERYRRQTTDSRQTTDGRSTPISERERVFTFAKMDISFGDRVESDWGTTPLALP